MSRRLTAARLRKMQAARKEKAEYRSSGAMAADQERRLRALALPRHALLIFLNSTATTPGDTLDARASILTALEGGGAKLSPTEQKIYSNITIARGAGHGREDTGTKVIYRG